MPKKKSQIENKDLSDDISKITGDELAKLKDNLMQMTYSILLKDASLAPSDWVKKQRGYEQELVKDVKEIIKTEGTKIVKSVGKGLEMLDVAKEDTVKVQKTVKNGIQQLNGLVIGSYRNNVSGVTTTLFKSNVAEPLFNQIKEKITQTENYGIVVYKDGKKFRWENYMEMKVRTDIQQDIGKSMVENGLKTGNIFYICSYHGDCAPDHKDYQGKIYIDKNWKNAVKNEKLIEKIEAYISTNSVKTIQEIMGPQAYLTTRPNCRHYFQYISIEEVLKIKNSNDLNSKREEMNLNSKGKYKPEKYEALKQQRYNERKIRTIKGKIETQKKIVNAMPKDSDKIKENVKTSLLTTKLREAQKMQRDLIKEANKNEIVLDRNYNREAYNKMISDLGTSKLTNGSNSGNIKAGSEILRVEDISDLKFFDENCQLREEYHSLLSKIKDCIPTNVSLEEQAKYAFDQRNEIRIIIRNKMHDKKALEFLGFNKPNPTFNKMIEHKIDKLKHNDQEISIEEIYRDIIKTSDKSNKIFDELFKKKE